MKRRTLLRRTGASLGALVIGSAVASADSPRRFVVDRRSLRNENAVEMVHEMDPVDLLVVRATEEQLEDQRAEFAPDIRLSLGPFDPVRADARDENGDSFDEDLFKYQWDKQDQRILEAHEEFTRGEGTRVAIIDSGIATGHPDLEGQVNLDLSKNFTDDDLDVGGPYGGSHGTHVAGIAGASDDGTGVVGSAPGAELVDLRVFSAAPDSAFSADSGGSDGQELPPDYLSDTFMGSVMAALVYAAEIDCEAANLSLGWTWLMRWEGWNKFWGKVHQRVGNYARRKGTIHTHASGNWGESLTFNQDETDSSETAGGITTSATGPVGFDPETGEYEEPPSSPSTYTTHGVGAIDLGAPGGKGGEHFYDNVLNATAFPKFDEDTGEYLGADYGYGWWAGTSMAAPQVAGALALVRSYNPSYTGNQARSTLKRAADHPDEYERKYYGSGGYLDTYGALAKSHAGLD